MYVMIDGEFMSCWFACTNGVPWYLDLSSALHNVYQSMHGAVGLSSYDTVIFKIIVACKSETLSSSCLLITLPK